MSFGQGRKGAFGSGRLVLALALLLLVAAFLLGGTGVDLPVRGTIIEALSLASLAVTIANWHGPRPPIAILGGLTLIVAIPALQLVPLPPSLWKALPGREIAADVSSLIGAADAWRPLSLNPELTLKSLLGMLPAFALYLAARQLPVAGRRLLLRALIAVALCSIALGGLQVISHNPSLYPFESLHEGLPIGLFANRNHQADLLVVATLAAAALHAATPEGQAGRTERLVLTALIGLFVAGIFATASRTGLVLVMLGLALSAPFFVRGKLGWKPVAAGGALILLAGMLLSTSGVVQTTLERYGGNEADERFQIWPEAYYAAKYYFPVGGGMGTFVGSFNATEQLGTLSSHYTNAAHNDYIQLTQDGGAAGLAVVLLFCCFYIVNATILLGRPIGDHADRFARMALIAILAYLLHSIVDFPLRTFAHIALFGMLCGLLARPPTTRDDAA